jgi:RHS repeat-associated protein
MKKLLYLILLIPVLALGQSIDQNFVKKTIFKDTISATNPSPDITSANITISYFDGLGRPIQQIAHKQSNTGKDIVTHIEYDQFGRQTRDYLPYVSIGASLNYLSSAQTDLLNFYSSPNTTSTGNPHFEATSNPFSEKQLESSPLNRVFKQAAPGDAWGLPQTTGSSEDRSIKFDYQTNQDTDGVKLFKVISSWNPSKELYEPAIVQTSFYSENQLYKTITKDENWTSGKNNTTEEFKDKEGKVVLKRTYNDIIIDGVLMESQAKHDTHYIYDQFGNLTYVIPPLAEGVATQIKLDNLGYQYKYDGRNRLVEKKLPGKDWEFIVYDKIDRPIATGPAYNPYGDGTLGWMITEYDVFGRVTQTGWKLMTVNETERKNNQVDVNSGGNPFVLLQNEILTKNFYDNYSFAGAPSMPQTIEGQNAKINVKGLPTGSWVRVLDVLGSTTAETSFTLYDYKYRPIRVRTTNFLGGYTEVDSKLDWSGKVEKTVTKHKYNSGSTVLTTTETFTYSPQDKLVLHKHKINTGSEELIAKNNYDELGQLIRKEVGGQNFSGANSFQKVDYKYNIRGWLKEINDVDDLSIDNDLFAFKINYNEGLDPLFNGNISETFWITDNNNVLRKYEHHYDKLNRLTESNFSFPANSDNIGMPFSVTDSYREKLSYDKNGNITSLLRNGEIEDDNYVVEIDNLTYFYNSVNKNLLEQVTDQSNHPKGFKDDGDGLRDYYYDGFGNLKKDNNKDIDSIFYNHMNLPVEIVFVSGDKINYIYNALGQKISKVVNSNSSIIVTDYLSGGFQYVDGNLSFFPHAEGYIKAKNINGVNNYNYVYNYLDHLGNVRLSYSDIDSNGILGDEYVQECITTLGGKNSPVIICSDYFTSPIIEENHYYPFGLKHEGYPGETNNPNYKYRYNSKEYQDELGLNMYDYGARNYDPAIGRWMNIDPLAEQYRRWSPYNYVMNSPMILVDPDGMRVSYGDFIDNAGREENNGEPKKKKSTAQLMGEGYAMGYSVTGGGFNAAVNGRDAYKPTAEDDEAAGDAFVNTVLFITGEYTFGLLVKGGKYLWALRGASNFGKLSYASSYGIKSYKALKELTKGKGLQVHHLIEQRFASTLGVDPSAMKSIVLTNAEHQTFTNAWRAQIGYRTDNVLIRTTNASKEQIYEAARVIYKDYPEIIKALGL